MILIVGAGSAGYGTFKILDAAGCRNIVVADSRGSIYEGRDDIVKENRNPYKLEIALKINAQKLSSNSEEIINEFDIVIEVSGRKKIITKQMVRLCSRMQSYLHLVS